MVQHLTIVIYISLSKDLINGSKTNQMTVSAVETLQTLISLSKDLINGIKTKQNDRQCGRKRFKHHSS